MPGPLSAHEAALAVQAATSIDEVYAIASQVSAAPDTPGIILYTGVTEFAKNAASDETGSSLIDSTERAAFLQSDRFKSKLCELCGMLEKDLASQLDLLDRASQLADGHPDKAAALRAAELLYGATGDGSSLRNSFWGRASREFVEQAGGEVLLLLGQEAKRVFWGVELPAILNGPLHHVINDVVVSDLPSTIDEAFERLKQEGRRRAEQYEALGKEALLAVVDEAASCMITPTAAYLASVAESVLEPDSPLAMPSVQRCSGGAGSSRLGWIELIVRDEAGQAVTGIDCVIVAPDGSRHPARTDDQGIVRVSGIPDGDCRIEFPRHDVETVVPNQ